MDELIRRLVADVGIDQGIAVDGGLVDDVLMQLKVGP